MAFLNTHSNPLAVPMVGGVIVGGSDKNNRKVGARRSQTLS
jgi:hypothetical protein